MISQRFITFHVSVKAPVEETGTDKKAWGSVCFCGGALPGLNHWLEFSYRSCRSDRLLMGKRTWQVIPFLTSPLMPLAKVNLVFSNLTKTLKAGWLFMTIMSEPTSEMMPGSMPHSVYA